MTDTLRADLPGPISEHTEAEGWPMDPGTPVWWHDAHGNRCEGFYLRLNIDDLEAMWGDEPARQGFLYAMTEESETCLECHSDLDEDGDCPNGCEPFQNHPQGDTIRFEAAYGIRARVSREWPAGDPPFHEDVVLDHLVRRETASS